MGQYLITSCIKAQVTGMLDLCAIVGLELLPLKNKSQHSQQINLIVLRQKLVYRDKILSQIHISNTLKTNSDMFGMRFNFVCFVWIVIAGFKLLKTYNSCTNINITIGKLKHLLSLSEHDRIYSED